MAADLGAKFVRINAAKKAAGDLRERASNCKNAYLRDEGDAMVNEALQVIRQIEDKAIDPNCNLLDETIGRAALKAEDALRKLEGRIAASERKGKSGSLLSKLSKQITNPDKQIFKDARDALKLVLPCLTEAADAGLTDSEDEAAEQHEQQQQPSLDSTSSTEQRWSYTKGNLKVSTVALIPGLDGSTSHSTLWVCLNKKVEFYVGCNSNTKSEVVLPDKGQAVTCAAFDKLGGVWTGHADGSVWIHLQGTWCAAQHPTNVGLPIRSMTFDHKGYCWVGDEAGIIRVLVFDSNTGRMSCRIHLAPPQTQNLMMMARQQGPAAAAAAFNASTSSSSLSRLGSGSGSNLNKSSAVAAMVSQGLGVLSSGGEWANSITLWHSGNYQKLEVSSCDSYGATCSFTVLPWDPPAAGSSASAATQDDAIAVAGVPASGIALGYAAAPIATVPARITAASAAKQGRVPVSGLVAGKAADTSDYSSWRLLSGHERGQVLLWQLHGVTRSAAAIKLLQLLTVIGEARPQHGVRSMAVFKDLSMLALVHTSGGFTALPLPTATNGAVATTTTSGASFYAVGVPAGRPAAPGTGGSYAATPHCWVPPAARIKAHKHPVVAAATLGEMLVTASSNTVKLWTADQLKVEAQGEGLMFSRSSNISQQVATADALAAAIAAADNSSSSAAAPATPTRGESADRAAAAAAAVASAATDQQQTVLGVPQQQVHDTPVIAVDAQADATDSEAREASMSAFLEAGAAAAADAATSLPVPASCTAANPMSRENARARGLQVDATGTVVLKQHSAEPGSTFPVYPMSAMPMSYPAMPPIGTEYPAGQAAPSAAPDGSPASARPPLNHAQSSPVGNAGLTVGSSSSGLDTSSSVSSDGIKVHHIICNSELVLKEVIGSGAEGKVYRGTWTNIDIAAKEYLAVDDLEGSSGGYDSLSDAAMQRAKNALHKEVVLLTSLNHPNLVRFCGVCLDPPLVVMEYYKFGNVFSLLEKARIQWQMHQANSTSQQKSKQSNKYMNYLTWDRRLEMLHDVAAGMMYLHKRHYVHGDLRSPNLFVGQDGRVKIGDFGFTKRLKSKQSSMQVKRITHPRWVAPELLGEYRLSAASDVYSFGIIMYEMLTWQLPFHNLHKEQVVFNVLSEALRPEIPEDDQLPPFTSSSTCLGNYKKLMQECWAQEPDKRPTFDKIAARLKAMIRWRLVIQRLSPAAKASARRKHIMQAQQAKGQSSKLDIASAVTKVIIDKSAAAAAAASTVVDDDPEELPVPDHPIVQVPAQVEQQHAVGTPAAAAGEGSVMLFTVARAGSAPPAAAGSITATRSLSRLTPVEEHSAAADDEQQPDDAPSIQDVGPEQHHQEQQQSGSESSSTPVALPSAQSHDVTGVESSEGPTAVSVSELSGNVVSSRRNNPADSAAAVGLPATSGAADAAAAADSARHVFTAVNGCDASSLCTPNTSTTSTTTAAAVHEVFVKSSEGDDQLSQASQTASGEVSDRVLRTAAVMVTSSPAAPAAAAAAGLHGGVSGSSVPAGYLVPLAAGGAVSPGTTAGQHRDTAVRQLPVDAADAADASSSSVEATYRAAGDIDVGGSSAAAADAAALSPLLQQHLQQQQESAFSAVLPAAEVVLQQAGASAGAAAVGVDNTPSWSQHQQQGMQLQSAVQQAQHMQAAATAAAAGLALMQQQQQSELQCLQQMTCAAVAEPGLPTASGVMTADLEPINSSVSPFLAVAAAASTNMLPIALQQQQQQAIAQVPDIDISASLFAAAAAPPPVAAAADPFVDHVADVDLGAFAVAREQHQQQQQQPDHYTAADSPFCWTFGAALDSCSADLPPVGAFAAAAAAAAGSGSTGAAHIPTGAFPSCLLTADYLDDSKLPLDDDGPRLGAAVTVVYPEGQAVVDAAIRSSCTLKTPSGTTSGSNCTMPSLGEGVAAVRRSWEGLTPAAGAAATAAGHVISFAGAEASPFAQSGFADDPCESIGLGGGLKPVAAAAAGDAAHISMGASPFAAAVAAGGLGAEYSIAAPVTSDEMNRTAVYTSMPPPAAAAAAGGDGGLYPPWVYQAAAMNGVTAAAVSAAAAGGAFFPPTAAPPGWTAAAGPGQHQHAAMLQQQHQRSPSWQAGDGAAGWMQGIPQQQQGMVGFNPGTAGDGGLVNMSHHLMQQGHLGLAGSQTAAAVARRSASASPELTWQQGSSTSQQSAQDAAAAAADSATAAIQYNRPLGDDVLNRRLGTSDEDVTEQAKRALQVWEKTMKARRTSAPADDGLRQQQQHDGAGDLSRLSAASDATARTASPAAALHPALLAQLMANPTAAVAAGCGYPGIDPSLATAYLMNAPMPAAAAAGLGPRVQQPPGISQLQPGDKVKVVNRPTHAYLGAMDSNSMMAQQLQYMHMQKAAAAAGGGVGGHAWLPGGRPAGGFMQQGLTHAAGLGQQQQQQHQQAEMMAALLHQQQQQQLLERGLMGTAADGGAVVGNVSSGMSAVDAAALIDRWSHAVTGSGGAPAALSQADMMMETAQQQQQQQQQQLAQQLQQQQQLQSLQQMYMQQQQMQYSQQQTAQQQQMMQQQIMQQHPQWQQSSQQQQQQPPSPVGALRPAASSTQGGAAAQQQARLQRLPAQRR